jgi:hypothetical protein
VLPGNPPLLVHAGGQGFHHLHWPQATHHHHQPWQLAAAMQSIPVPEQRFTHLHVYLVGPLPTSAEGFKFLFTIINWKPFRSRTWKC